MVKAVLWGFVLLWFVLGTVTGSAWVSFIAAIVILGLLADASSRAKLLRAFRWTVAKVDTLSAIGIGILVMGILCFAAGASLVVGAALTAVTYFVLLGIAALGAFAHRRAKNAGFSAADIVREHAALSLFRDAGIHDGLGSPEHLRFPFTWSSTFLDACLGIVTDRLAGLQGGGASVIGAIFTAVAFWLKEPAWYWLPLYFVGGTFLGTGLTFAVSNSLKGGWNLLVPVVLSDDEATGPSATLADPIELKKSGLSRDL